MKPTQPDQLGEIAYPNVPVQVGFDVITDGLLVSRAKAPGDFVGGCEGLALKGA